MKKDNRGDGCTYTLTLIQADVHGASELDVGGVWELERAELSSQEVTIDGVEVLKEVRVHRAAEKKKGQREARISSDQDSPVEDDGLLLTQSIRHLHKGDSEAVDW